MRISEWFSSIVKKPDNSKQATLHSTDQDRGPRGRKTFYILVICIGVTAWLLYLALQSDYEVEESEGSTFVPRTRVILSSPSVLPLSEDVLDCLANFLTKEEFDSMRAGELLPNAQTLNAMRRCFQDYP